MDVALGLRPYGQDLWMSEESLASCQLVKEKGRLVLRRKQGENQLHEWRFSAQDGMALVSYSVLSNGKPFVETACDDFRTVHGLRLPGKAVQRLRGPLNDGAVVYECELSGITYELPDAGDRSRPLEMVWPAGTYVLDARTNRTVRVQTATTLPDSVLHERSGGPDQGAAKPLPNAQDRINKAQQQ